MFVSVVCILRNEEKFIQRNLAALSGQDHKDFEIVFVDNGSSDKTADMIRKFEDPRVRLVVEPRNLGLGELRNIGVRHACGEFVFFTDGDCVPSHNWISEGLNAFTSDSILGVEGRTFYEYETNPTVSDFNTESLTPGRYMTCNMAYRTAAINGIGGFDPECTHNHEDRELAIRISEIGSIVYSDQMLVCHANKKLNAESVIKRTYRAECMVYIIKKHRARHYKRQYVLYPQHLLIMFLPFLIITHYSYRSRRDIYIGVIKFLSLFLERALIWRAAIRHRVFVF